MIWSARARSSLASAVARSRWNWRTSKVVVVAAGKPGLGGSQRLRGKVAGKPAGLDAFRGGFHLAGGIVGLDEDLLFDAFDRDERPGGFESDFVQIHTF